jgi:uncharacterized damage-inducible protein DinB
MLRREIMKIGCFLVGLCLSAGLTVAPVLAQDAAKKDEMAKPTKTPSQLLLDQWNDIGRKLIAMAEDMPEDKYDSKPTPAQRTFAEQLLHAAGANYYFTNLTSGKNPPPQEDPKRSDYKTKADVVAFVKKSFADGAAAITAKGDKGLSDWLTDPGSKEKYQVGDLAYGFIEHSGEHYGQLVVYYRVNGLVPPESRPKK